MNYTVIFAGGSGQRMNSKSIPKQFLMVHGKPIIVHTIEKFNNCEKIDKIIVVCIESRLDYMKELTIKYNLNKVTDIVAGGKSGQESIFNGLKQINNKYGIKDNDIVLIHDGVRPVIDNDTIINNINCVINNGSAITVAKSVETVLLSDGNNEMSSIMDRNKCLLGRAPQSFYLKDIYNSHLKAINDNNYSFIDSAMLMKHYGYTLHTVMGPSENIKITTPIDFFLFRAILDAKEDEQINLL